MRARAVSPAAAACGLVLVLLCLAQATLAVSGSSKAGQQQLDISSLLHPQDWLNPEAKVQPIHTAEPRFTTRHAQTKGEPLKDATTQPAQQQKTNSTAAKGTTAPAPAKSSAPTAPTKTNATAPAAQQQKSSAPAPAAQQKTNATAPAQQKAGGAPAAQQQTSGSASAQQQQQSKASTQQQENKASTQQQQQNKASQGKGQAKGHGKNKPPRILKVIDAEPTVRTRGVLGRANFGGTSAGTVVYHNGRKMMVPIIANTDAAKPLGETPVSITSEKPAKVVGTTTSSCASADCCETDCCEDSCRPLTHVPIVVDKLQPIPQAPAPPKKPTVDDVLKENGLEPLAAAPWLAAGGDAPLGVNPALAAASASNPALNPLNFMTGLSSESTANAAAIAAANGLSLPPPAVYAAQQQVQQNLAAASEASAAAPQPQVAAAENSIDAEFLRQLKAMDEDRLALRAQIDLTKNALKRLGGTEDGVIDFGGADYLSDIGEIDDPVDLTGNPVTKKRRAAILAKIAALRQQTAAQQQAPQPKAQVPSAPQPTTVDALAKSLFDDKRSSLLQNRLVREYRARSGSGADADLLADALGGKLNARAQLDAAAFGDDLAIDDMVAELDKLVQKRKGTHDAELQESLDLEIELMVLRIKKANQSRERKEEALNARIPPVELSEDQILDNALAHLTKLRHTRGQAARTRLFEQVAHSLEGLKKLNTANSNLLEKAAIQALSEAAAESTAESTAESSSINPVYSDEESALASHNAACAATCHVERQMCHEHCQESGEDQCHSTCRATHRTCCRQNPKVTPEIVENTKKEYVTPVVASEQCRARFRECAAQKDQCHVSCADDLDQDACKQECVVRHDDCSSSCKVEADEVVRDQCGQCYVVKSACHDTCSVGSDGNCHDSCETDHDSCTKDMCHVSPVVVHSDGTVTKDATVEAEEILTPEALQKIVTEFIRAQTKFNNDIVAKVKELRHFEVNHVHPADNAKGTVPGEKLPSEVSEESSESGEHALSVKEHSESSKESSESSKKAESSEHPLDDTEVARLEDLLSSIKKDSQN